MFACKYYQAGNCRYGQTCRNRHIRISDEINLKYRTVVCSFYSKGHCRNGDNCSFLHQDDASDLSWKYEDVPRTYKQCENLIDEKRNAWIENNYSKWRVESELDNLSDKFRFNVPSPTSDGDCIFYSSDSDMELERFDVRQINRLQSTTLTLSYCTHCKMDFLSGETGRAVCVYCGVPQGELVLQDQEPSISLDHNAQDEVNQPESRLSIVESIQCNSAGFALNSSQTICAPIESLKSQAEVQSVKAEVDPDVIRGRKKKRRKKKKNLISNVENISPCQPEEDFTCVDNAETVTVSDVSEDHRFLQKTRKKLKRQKKREENMKIMNDQSEELKVIHEFDRGTSFIGSSNFMIIEILIKLCWTLTTLVFFLLWEVIRLALKLARQVSSMLFNLMMDRTLSLLSRMDCQRKSYQISVKFLFMLLSNLTVVYGKCEGFIIGMLHQRHKVCIPNIMFTAENIGYKRSRKEPECYFAIRNDTCAGNPAVAENRITAEIEKRTFSSDLLRSARAAARYEQNKYLQALSDLYSINTLIFDDLVLMSKCYISLGLVEMANKALEMCSAKDSEWLENPDCRFAKELISYYREALTLGRLNHPDPKYIQSNFPSYHVSLLSDLHVMTYNDVQGNPLEHSSSWYSIEEPVRNYWEAVHSMNSDNLFEAELLFRLCARQNYKTERCLELSRACKQVRLNFSRGLLALQVGLFYAAYEIYYSLATASQVSDFLCTKLKLFEASIYLYHDQKLSMQLCNLYSKKYPALKPKFMLIKSNILIAEREYRKASSILHSLRNDATLDWEVFFWKNSLDKQMKRTSLKTHYDILGLDKEATENQIQEAYDTWINGGKIYKYNQRVEEFDEIFEKDYRIAYQILIDEEARKMYDVSIEKQSEEKFEAKRLCHEELGEILRKWWAKRHGKMRLEKRPSREQVAQFLQTFTREKHIHLLTKFKMDSTTLMEVVDEFCSKANLNRYL